MWYFPTIPDSIVVEYASGWRIIEMLRKKMGIAHLKLSKDVLEFHHTELVMDETEYTSQFHNNET